MDENTKFNFGLSAAFSAFLTVVSLPFVSPIVDAVATGAFSIQYLDMAFDIGHWLEYWTSGSWVSHTPLAMLTFSATALALFIYTLYRDAANGRTVDNGIYGDATIVKGAAELKRRNDFASAHKPHAGAGLAIGSGKAGIYYDTSVPHAITVGKTGSGKTQLMVLQTLYLCMSASPDPWNLIVTGKPELYELTSRKAAELGYRVVHYDLAGYPGASGFNPIDLVARLIGDGRIDEAARSARQVANDLIPLAGEKNPYFPKAARSALTAAILVVCTADIPLVQKNMASVSALIARGTTSGSSGDPSRHLKDYILSLGPAHPAFSPAADFLSDGGQTTAGKNVLSTLKEAVGIFDDPGLRSITSASDVSIRDIVRERSVVYMEMPEPGDPYMPVYKCWFSQYWKLAQEEARANAGRLPHETAIVGDELGNMGRIDCLPEIATLGRSMGLRLYAFVQNLAQLNAYNDPGDDGAGREKLLGSVGLKVALSLAEPNDWAYFSRLTGKRTVRSMGTSDQRSAGRRSNSTSYNEQGVPLINEWEWQGRIPVRDGLIAVKGGENSKPGREGVFDFSVDYASRTPAGPFFGLGTEEDERRTRSRVYAAELVAARDAPRAVPEAWCPDFPAQEGTAGAPAPKSPIEADEWSAWDD